MAAVYFVVFQLSPRLHTLHSGDGLLGKCVALIKCQIKKMWENEKQERVSTSVILKYGGKKYGGF